MKQVCILLAVLLCMAAVANAAIPVYAPSCARCKSIGARTCGYGEVNSKGVQCFAQTTIKNCKDCKRKAGYCQNSECFLEWV